MLLPCNYDRTLIGNEWDEKLIGFEMTSNTVIFRAYALLRRLARTKNYTPFFPIVELTTGSIHDLYASPVTDDWS